MDEIKRALLGDKAAQQAVTDRGELLPCHCGGVPIIFFDFKIETPSGEHGYLALIKCPNCWLELGRWELKKEWAIESAKKAWNTRPQLLTAEEMERLEG